MNSMEIQAFLAIRRGSVSSRAELARFFSISRPTASVIAEKLISAGMIRESGKGASRIGKAPTLLTVVPERSHILGLDLGYTDRMHAVVLDAAGNIVNFSEISFDSASPDDAVRKAKSLEKKLGKGILFSGIAAAVSGVADESGTILRSINPAFCGSMFRDQLNRAFSLPVLVENRSRTAAVSEAFGGAVSGEGDFALISLGKSIGAAIYLNGALYRGAHYETGEIRGLRLACGMTLEEAMRVVSVEKNGLEKTAVLCAEGLAQFLSVTGLDLLVLAGRFADYGQDFADLLSASLPEEFQCRIRIARFGRSCAARGAAFLLGEQLESTSK